jgi:superoxide dismutase, Cu-Zn family
VPRSMRITITALAAASALGLATAATMTGSAGAHDQLSRASLRTANGVRIGIVEFANLASDRTEVTVRLRGAAGVAAFHGIHIHANDDSTNGVGCIADASQPSTTWFVSADGHWKHDPNELHGHHAGDLPSVFVNANGTSSIRFVLDKLTPKEVVGRAVILHAGPDNFGNVPVGPNADQYKPGPDAVAKTQATGNAGDRIACGVIAKA